MDKLNILWTTTNKETVFDMISMYAVNSVKNEWWNNVNVIIWGPSAKMIGGDKLVQTEILEMLHNGVSVEACKACCDNYGVSEILAKLGVTVRFMGEPLTEYLKKGEKVLTL